MPPETGTYVSDWWGIYAPARALLVAAEIGAPVSPHATALAKQELASSADNPNAGEPITFEEHEELAEALDTAEAWLNEHRSSPYTYWGWQDGAWGHFEIGPDDLETIRTA
jgi:hypothetical protein